MLNTGVGAVYGQVNVEPIRVSTSQSMSPEGSLEAMLDVLAVDYIPSLGTVISEREAITLDGIEANISFVQSDSAVTKTKALIVVRANEAYATANGDVQFMLVSFVIPDETGPEVIDTLIGSWRWN